MTDRAIITDRQEDDRFSREMAVILDRFPYAKEWVDLSNLLEQLKKSFERFSHSTIPMKKQLAKRLSQCLAPELIAIHEQTLEIYTEVFKRTLESNQTAQEASDKPSDATFGQDMGLFISNLYNFYQLAKFKEKEKFLDLVKNYILKFEKELLMSLSSFMLFILPALDESNENMIAKVHAILHEVEKIVGTSKFYGEIWKTMLRSTRAREMAIKYLDIKVPKDIDEAASLNPQNGAASQQVHKKNQVYLSKYNLVIKKNKMLVEMVDFSQVSTESSLPQWAQNELQMFEKLQQAPDRCKLENRYMSGELDAQGERERQEIRKALFYFYYPDRRNLVINAIIAGLQDLGNNLAVRATFDFMMSHIKINGDFLIQDERVNVVETALLTLIEKDFASQKKFFKWCFEHLEEKATMNDPAVTSCIGAVQRILKKFSNLKSKSSDSGSNIQTEGSAREFQIFHPIRILQTLFQDEDMDDVVILMLDGITVDLIKYIYKHYNDPQIKDQELLRLKQSVDPFFETIHSHQSQMWQQLGTLLRNEIDSIDKQYSSVDRKSEAIELIICCLDELLPNSQQALENKSESVIIKLKSQKHQQQTLENKVQRKLDHIVSILLRHFEKLTDNFTQLALAIPALKLLKKILPTIKYHKIKGQKEVNTIKNSIEHFNKFYQQIIEKLSKSEFMRRNSPDLETFRQASEILCDIQKYADPEAFKQEPTWLVEVIKCAKNSNNQRTQLVAIEVLIKIIEPKRHEDYADAEARQNIYNLQQLISPQEIQRTTTIRHGHTNLNVSKDKQSDRQNTHDSFQSADFSEEEDFRDRLCSADSDALSLALASKSSVTENPDADSSIFMGSQVQGISALAAAPQPEQDHCAQIIGTLWSLLKHPGDHQKIVTLLKKFDLLKPKLFSNVIIEDLSNQNRDVKRQAVEKFSTFWKLAAYEKAIGEGTYMPFQPENERHSEMILSRNTSKRVSQNQYKQRNYDALHKMLMILEDKDPTLRLSTRSWLQDSKSDFSRIIDPLLKESMNNNKMHLSFSGQLFFSKEYNANYVNENFTKLKNILLTTQEDFVKYICINKYSVFIELDFDEVTAMIGQHNFKTEEYKNRYISGIVSLTLQFIMGQYVQVLSEEHYQDTQVVNASACEFMELLIRSISQYPDLCTEMIHLVVGRLIKTLRVAIDNQNDAQQVILLNLLQVLLFEHEKLFAEREEEARDLFQDELFFKCFTDGLNSQSAFVRFHYIKFVQKLVIVLQKVLQPTKLAGFISSLIDCFCDLLHQADISAYESNIRAGKTLMFDDDDEVADLDSQINLSKKNPYVKKLVISQENEILQLIDGFGTIIDRCLGTRRQSDIQLQQDEEEKVQKLGGGQRRNTTTFNLFNLLSAGGFTPLDTDEQLKRVFSEKADRIISTFLSCWNDFDVFRAREFFFTTLGIFSFNEQDRTTMEKHLKEKLDTDGNESNEKMLRKYYESQLNPIQSKIIQSLRPVTEKLPRKIVQSYLQNWMKRMQQKTNLVEQNFAQSKLDGQTCENTLQMLLTLQVPAHDVIESINDYIQEKEWRQPRRRGVLIMNKQERVVGQNESSLCHFIYSYLMHNIQFTQIKSSESVDEFKGNKLRLYKQILDFIDHLKWSRHPNTTCWLIEILHILSNKFIAPQQIINTYLQDQMEGILQFLLEAAASIINSEPKLEFGSREEYHLRHLQLSPTVYEMLKRFEFVLGDIPVQEPTFNMAESYASVKFSVNANQDSKVSAIEVTKQSNRAPGLIFSTALKQAYPKLPIFEDTISHELQIDFEESQRLEKESLEKPVLSMSRNMSVDSIQETSSIIDYMDSLRKKVHNSSSKALDMNEVHRICTVVTLRQVLTQLTGKVHSTAHRQNQIQKRKYAESIIVNRVMNLIQAQIDQKFIESQHMPASKMDSFVSIVDQRDQAYFELLTELLRSVTSVQHKVQTHYKQQIENIFTAKGFFQMSKRSLRKWQIIMQQYTTTNTDLWTDLLQAFDSQGGLFTSNMQKMKSQSDVFRQLSFLIFSTKKDQIKHQLDPLLKKMADSFKATNKEQSFVTSLFLLSRILMLRLGSRRLAEALKRLWPHLQAELVAVFDRDSSENNPMLTKEAIKVVELMSQLNIDEFQINQWMFMFDGYGIKEVDYQTSMMSASMSNRCPSLEMCENTSEKPMFQPYLVQYMSNSHFELYNTDKCNEQDSQENSPDDGLANPALGQFLLRDTASFVTNPVHKYAVELQKKVDQTNIRMMQLDEQAADALIEKDFLQSK